MFTWLLEKFGGERTKLKGRVDAVKYSAANFTDMWILVQRGEASPSEGHAVDHVGWRVLDLNAKVAERAYVEGPAGTKIELVQR